jgi:hypothetical protein
MMDAIKVLGQLSPAATTLTTLYSAPAPAVASSITICNQATSVGTFRVSVRVAGAPDNAKQYIYYDQTLAAKSTFIATIGITLAPNDVVSVYSSSATMSFNLFGTETA